MHSNKLRYLTEKLGHRPYGIAVITGSPEYPDILGKVLLYNTPFGVLMCCDMTGLPYNKRNCGAGVFGLKLHRGMQRCFECGGFFENENIDNQAFPNFLASSDNTVEMPDIYENMGYAFLSYLTTKFCIEDVMGGTIVVYQNSADNSKSPDTYSDKRIACGDIKRIR